MPLTRIRNVLAIVAYAASLVAAIAILMWTVHASRVQLDELRVALAASEERNREQHRRSEADRANLRRNLDDVHAEVTRTLKQVERNSERLGTAARP